MYYLPPQLVVWRYTDGDFVKLDEQLFQMASPGTTTGSVPSLTFIGAPLEVTGPIDSKGDLQFQVRRKNKRPFRIVAWHNVR